LTSAQATLVDYTILGYIVGCHIYSKVNLKCNCWKLRGGGHVSQCPIAGDALAAEISDSRQNGAEFSLISITDTQRGRKKESVSVGPHNAH